MLAGTNGKAMIDHFIRGADPEHPHLFPTRRFGGYGMSVQADANGYGCSPRERFDDIRRYDTVEVQLYGPGGPLEITRTPLPAEVKRYFPRHGGNVAFQVPQRALDSFEESLKALSDLAPDPGPADRSTTPVELSDAGLREVLIKLREAIVEDTGEVNADLVEAIGVLMGSARDRGVDLGGIEVLDELAPGGPKP